MLKIFTNGAEIKKYVYAAYLALALFALAGCKSGYVASGNKGSDSKTAAPRQVKTIRVTEKPVTQSVTTTGTLAAYDQATLSVKVPGRIQSITVDLGSVVRKGQLAAQIEQTDYLLRKQQAEAALMQARARLGLPPEGDDDSIDAEQTAPVKQAQALLDEARLKQQRIASLLKQGLVSQSDYDAAESALKVALSRHQDALEEIRNRQGALAQRRSELALAKQQLLDTSIYAPFDGIVQEKRASVGEYLQAGAPVVALVKNNPIRLRAEIPERDARIVRVGQKVRITIEGDPNVYTGNVMRISPIIAEQNRMLLMEAEFANNGKLRPGSFAKAELLTDKSNLVKSVPVNAIVSFAGIEKVIIVKDGKALEKPISTGRRIGDWAEVISGVETGEQIVSDPGNLQSGMAVTVTEQAE